MSREKDLTDTVTKHEILSRLRVSVSMDGFCNHHRNPVTGRHLINTSVKRWREEAVTRISKTLSRTESHLFLVICHRVGGMFHR